ncbi:MAG: rhomboid family intramembrane serine protease [Saprospiraceae bacterium]
MDTVVQNQENRLLRSVRFSLRFVVVIWIVHIFQVLTTMDLGYLGLYPRTVFGLRGIAFAPLLHGDFQHLISNSVPFFVMTTMLFFFYKRVANKSFWMMYLLTGIAVWAMGRSVFHIGLSGVVYALAGFMVFSGFFRRNLKAIILSLIVVFLYGGMIWGVLPIQPGVSWESHLLGGIVGILTAYWYKEDIEADEVKEKYSWETEPEQLENQYFFERDIFDKTKTERQREKENGLPSWFSSKTWREE